MSSIKIPSILLLATNPVSAATQAVNSSLNDVNTVDTQPSSPPITKSFTINGAGNH